MSSVHVSSLLGYDFITVFIDFLSFSKGLHSELAQTTEGVSPGFLSCDKVSEISHMQRKVCCASWSRSTVPGLWCFDLVVAGEHGKRALFVSG